MLKKLKFIGGVALSALCLLPNVLTAQEVQAPTPSQQAQVNLFTIPNQSASYVRMPARQASQEIDAVFFNPAGTVNLDEGFHFTFNNQMLNNGLKSIMTMSFLTVRKAIQERLLDTSSQVPFSPTRKEIGIFMEAL